MSIKRTPAREQYVQENFGGDWAAYEADRKDGRRHTLSWDAVASAACVLPELDAQADAAIIRHLGYLPPVAVTLPHASFIRSLLAQSGLADEEREAAIAEHVRHIRNDDLRKGRWDCIPADYESTVYNQKLIAFRQAARDRLQLLLGYDPALANSMLAEMLLRELCARPQYCRDWEPTPYDFKALEIVRFCEVQSVLGPAAADASPLLAPLFKKSAAPATAAP